MDRKFFEGLLFGYKENLLTSLDVYEKLVLLALEMQKVSSIKIKNLDEAKYQQTKKVYETSIVELLYQEEIYKEQYNYFKTFTISVTKFLQKLDDEELSYIIDRFEKKLNLQQMADLRYTSAKVINYHLNKILEKFIW